MVLCACKPLVWAHAIRPPRAAALDDQRRMLCFNYGTAQWGASGGAVSLDGAVT